MKKPLENFQIPTQTQMEFTRKTFNSQSVVLLSVRTSIRVAFLLFSACLSATLPLKLVNIPLHLFIPLKHSLVHPTQKAPLSLSYKNSSATSLCSQTTTSTLQQLFGLASCIVVASFRLDKEQHVKVSGTKNDSVLQQLPEWLELARC